MPGDVNLWPNLTGGEAIDVIGRARDGLDKAKRAMLIERFDLDPKKKGRAYSKGNRQKAALIAALASDVELLRAGLPVRPYSAGLGAGHHARRPVPGARHGRRAYAHAGTRRLALGDAHGLKLPSDPMRWGASRLELVLGLAMLAAGLVGYRRRDIAGR